MFSFHPRNFDFISPLSSRFKLIFEIIKVQNKSNLCYCYVCKKQNKKKKMTTTLPFPRMQRARVCAFPCIFNHF